MEMSDGEERLDAERTHRDYLTKILSGAGYDMMIKEVWYDGDEIIYLVEIKEVFILD